MPFARWENFDECKLEQMQIGHSEEAAQTICETIQERAAKGLLFKSRGNLEILKGVDDDLIVGGYVSWELVDPQNDYVTTEAMVNFLAKFFNLPPEYHNITIDHGNFQIGKALLHYPEENPRYFTHVHEKGMYGIVKIRNDNFRRTQFYRDKIRKGEYKMFSIAGDPIRSEQVLMDKEVVRKIFDIDPFEWAIVKEGYNRKAKMEILKQKPKTDKQRLIAHYGEEKASKLLELVGEEAFKLLPSRGQKVIEKKVVQRGSQWCVVHCHEDGSVGETIKCFDTKEKADAMHRAIQANKSMQKQDTSFKKSVDKDNHLTFQHEAEAIFRKHFPEYKGE